MLVQDFLQNSACARPDKTALVCGSRRFTYAELDAMANRLANALRGQGIERGDRVAIYLGNCVEAIVAIFGILKADAIFAGKEGKADGHAAVECEPLDVHVSEDGSAAEVCLVLGC